MEVSERIEIDTIVKYPDGSVSLAHKPLQLTDSRHPQRLVITEGKPKKGDSFLWVSGLTGNAEIHKYHSDAGYGIKTYTMYDEKDNSSLIVNHSGCVGKVIAAYPAIPDTHFIDLSDIRRWIESGYPDSVELEIVPYDGKSSISENWDGALSVTNNTVKMVWGEVDLSKVFRWGEQDNRWNEVRKYKDSVVKYLTKCNVPLVTTNSELPCKEAILHVQNETIIGLAIINRVINDGLAKIAIYACEQVNDQPIAVKSDDMAKAYASSRALPGNQQWHSAYNHYIAIEKWRERQSATDWALFVKARYPDACIKKEGIEFIVYCPLLNIRLSDFCQTEDEAWCSAKIKIRNKG